MKNYLISCISKLSSKPRRSLYSDITLNNSVIEGYATNEAPAISVIRYISEKKLGKLDGIIAICTDTVSNEKISLDSTISLIDFEEESGVSDIASVTHLDFLKKRIGFETARYNNQYSDDPISYSVISVPDFQDDRQIVQASMEALTKLEPGQTNLFIDFNGGPRTMAFMLLAIANLVKIRDIHIERTLYMNYDNPNKAENKILIQELNSVFTSFDLISGLNEFINYGRIQGLKSFFKHSSNSRIKKILREMEVFSDKLMLCQTEGILEERINLKRSLYSYIEQVNDSKTVDAYEDLFAYIARDILSSYGGFLSGDLSDMLQWCINKDFIMQALTFVTELSPDFFQENAYKPSKKGWELFLKIYKALPKNLQQGEGYSWFNGFCDSWEYKEKKNSNWKSTEQKLDIPQENLPWPKEADVDKLAKRIQNNFCRKFDDQNFKSRDYFMCFKKAAQRTLLLKYTQRFQGVPDENQRSLMEDAFALYYILKKQRNNTNHANGESNHLWDMEKTRQYLQRYTDILKKLKSERS